MSQKKKVSCPVKHVNLFIVKSDDGSHKVKCVNSKLCKDECPFLTNPEYKSEFKRAPKFQAS